MAASLPYGMEKDKEAALESPGEEVKYDGEHDLEAAPASTLARDLKGRHMQMIAIGMQEILRSRVVVRLTW